MLLFIGHAEMAKIIKDILHYWTRNFHTSFLLFNPITSEFPPRLCERSFNVGHIYLFISYHAKLITLNFKKLNLCIVVLVESSSQEDVEI